MRKTLILLILIIFFSHSFSFGDSGQSTIPSSGVPKGYGAIKCGMSMKRVKQILAEKQIIITQEIDKGMQTKDRLFGETVYIYYTFTPISQKCMNIIMDFYPSDTDIFYTKIRRALVDKYGKPSPEYVDELSMPYWKWGDNEVIIFDEAMMGQAVVRVTYADMDLVNKSKEEQKKLDRNSKDKLNHSHVEEELKEGLPTNKMIFKYKIEGIMYSEDNPMVAINGKIRYLNDSVCEGKGKITNITPKRVTIKFEDAEKSYELGDTIAITQEGKVIRHDESKMDKMDKTDKSVSKSSPHKTVESKKTKPQESIPAEKRYSVVDTSRVGDVSLRLWHDGKFLQGYITFYNKKGQRCAVKKKKWDAELTNRTTREEEKYSFRGFSKRLHIYPQAFHKYDRIGYAYRIPPMRGSKPNERVYFSWEGLKVSATVSSFDPTKERKIEDKF